MNAVIIGQKWLACEVLKALSNSITIKQVIVLSNDNGLSHEASIRRIPITICDGPIDAGHIPRDTDLIICAHAHNYVTEEAIHKARLGAIGYHPSLLPHFKGKNAIQDLIRDNERITGGTVYWLDNTMDGGPIEIQDWCHVRPSDSPLDLCRSELAPMGVNLFERTIKNILSGKSSPIPQDNSLVRTKGSIMAE